MRALTVSPTARLVTGGLLGLALIAGAAVAHSSGPALKAAPAARVASLGPDGAARVLSARAAVTAAQGCAAPAAAAGWADNGSYGGNLVTAVAICAAESGGAPAIYACESTGTDGYYPPVHCTGGSYDRGLWQLNSKYQPQVTDACAFSALCNASAAYGISDDGTSFSPWATYTDDVYARYLPAAQAAVSGLTSGAVAGAVPGACLASSARRAGAAVVAAPCGRGAASQQWAVSAGAIRQGSRCLTAGAGQPAVTLSTCRGSAGQAWTAPVPGQLQDSRDGDCLTELGTPLGAGSPLGLAACGGAPGQTWWLP